MSLEKDDYRYISYSEFSQGNFPSIQEYLEEKPYINKDKIIQFLKNGKIEFARLSRARDIFTGERIPYEALAMSDGGFFWSNTLAWYVEKYNLRMPPEFEAYILRKFED